MHIIKNMYDLEVAVNTHIGSYIPLCILESTFRFSERIHDEVRDCGFCEITGL